MKKFILGCSVIAMLIFSSLTAFAIVGDGTEETPFIITNQGELELVTDFPDCHFRLANDIELEGTWIPLCKETSSGYFSGVFDGAGYTVSNLYTNTSYGGLFMHNNGIIKNLNVIISEEGLVGNGAIAYTNNGTVYNCVVNGNICGADQYVGGICAYNHCVIEQCKFHGNVESTNSDGYVGGICGHNSDGYRTSYSEITNSASIGTVTAKKYAGGICGYNDDKITNCYFIGSLSGGKYKGGITAYNFGYNDSYPAYITDCYAVSTFAETNMCYGISYGNGSYGKIQNSYYNKTVSGLSDTNTGTPKSTAAMKMKQTYSSNWDFDTVWGIDENINEGYPYLQWEYPDIESETSYTINSMTLTDLSGNKLNSIPNNSFNVNINVTKNNNEKNADKLIIAVYDENGVLIDLKYMSGIYYQNQTIDFGTMIPMYETKIGEIKAFVWDSLSNMTSLSNSIKLSK